MKIARLLLDGAERVGIVDGDHVQPLETGTSVLDLLAVDPGERDALAAAARSGDPVERAELSLLPPIQPASIRDFVSFEEHVEGVVRIAGRTVVPEWYEAPQFYFTNPHATSGRTTTSPSRQAARSSTTSSR